MYLSKYGVVAQVEDLVLPMVEQVIETDCATWFESRLHHKKNVMARSKILEKILNSITSEDMEKMKQKRIEQKNKLTSEFQLGYYVGLEIVRKHLPTLSTDMIQSRNVIQVSEEDSLENKRLDTEWYVTTKHGGEWNGVNENGDKEKWNLLYQHNKMLEKKYLPNPLKCHMSILNIQDLDDFKKGLRFALWDCDMCSYNIEPENIKIYDDEDYYFTIIELSLDSVV